MAVLIDSHCHLQSLEADAIGDTIRRARERGIEGFLIPAIRLDDADTVLRLCERHENVWCALGTHPHDAKTWRPGVDQKRLEGYLDEPGVVAVGECGLDFFYDYSPKKEQDRALREQWEVALEYELPVVVHNRDSNDEMLEVVRDPTFAQLRGDFHSFAGGLEMGEELIERGFFLGFTGMITFNRADNVREVLHVVPSDRWMVETDTPYLAPVPYRGKPNEPGYVLEVAERAAEELKLTLDEVAEQTNKNFFAMFPRATATGRLAAG